jgi:hypothetical protein
MNPFPHQQRATVACDQARAPCAVGTASLFKSRAMAYAVLPSVRSRTTRGHHVVWRRPRSAEDDTVVPSHG